MTLISAPAPSEFNRIYLQVKTRGREKADTVNISAKQLTSLASLSKKDTKAKPFPPLYSQQSQFK